MSEVENCPHCNKSLIGDPIPEHFSGHEIGDHWRLEIGIEYQGVYDGVWEWMCPFCEGRWDSEAKKARLGK